MTKTCRGCSRDLPFTAFAKHATGKFGLRPRGRDCCKKEGAALYQMRREAHLAKGQEWRRANPEKAREIARRNQRAMRLRAIDVMGGKCVECGAVEGLVLDHINGGGSEHRRHESNGRYYARFVREGGDPRFQVLCEAHHALKTSKEIAESNRTNPRTARHG